MDEPKAFTVEFLIMHCALSTRLATASSLFAQKGMTMNEQVETNSLYGVKF